MIFKSLFPKNKIGNFLFCESKKNKIRPQVFAALIYQESKGDIYAYKIERGWEEKLKDFSKDKLKNYGFVPRIVPSLEDEKRARSMSFGLTQVLGQTAREQGFNKQYLCELFEPFINIEWGIKIFKSKENAARRKLKTFDEGELLIQTLLFYNGGGDKSYPNKILKHIENGRYENIFKL